MGKKGLREKNPLSARAGLALAVILLALGLIVVAGTAAAESSPPKPAPERGAGAWTPLGGPTMPGGQVNALAVHPTISGTIYAAVAPAGAYDSGPTVIYKTTDGAATWTPVYTAQHQVYSLAASGSNVFAGAFNPGGVGTSIYLSQDSGLSWSPVLSFTSRGVWTDLAIRGSNPNAALASGWTYNDGLGRDEGVIYETTDGGLNWTPMLTVSTPGDNAHVVAVMSHPLTPTIILASVKTDSSPDSVIYRSDDSGATWPVSYTVANAHVISLLGHGGDPQLLYAGTGSSNFTGGPFWVLRSADAGLTWSEVLTNAGGRLAFEAPNTVHALAGWGGLWSSPADGDPGSWSSMGNVGEEAVAFDLDLGLAPAALYAGSNRRGIYKSTDGGANWQPQNGTIETLVRPGDIEIDPQNPNKILVVGECVGYLQTTDGGGSWIEPWPVEMCPHDTEIKPDDPGVVYMGGSSCSEGILWRSDDGGLSFTRVYTPVFIAGDCSGGDEAIQRVAVAPSMTGIVYAAGGARPNWSNWQAVVVRSADNGLTWSEVLTLPEGSFAYALAVDPFDADVAFVGGEDCSSGPCPGFVQRTTNGGLNWQPSLVTSQTVSSIVADAHNPGVVYAADRSYDVYKSSDGGATWTLIRSNRPPFNQLSGGLLALDPNLPGRIYLAGRGYVAESADGGDSWSDWVDPLNNGLPDGEPQALAMDPSSPVQTLYAGFIGLWAYSRLVPTEGTRYVATTGADADNNCTEPLSPCLTIGYALGLANGGESVLVAGGTYTENLDLTRPVMLSGGYLPSGGQWLPGGETIVDGSGSVISQSVVSVYGNGSGAVLEDLTLTGGSGTLGGGIYAEGADLTIRRCVIRNNYANGAPDSQGGGGVLAGPGSGLVTIVDSQIVDNLVGQGAGGIRQHQGHLVLINTLVAGNRGDPAVHVNSALSMMNSTISGNDDGVVFNPPPGTRMEAANTIIYGNGGGSIWNGAGIVEVSYSDVEGGWPGTGNIDADPLFEDAAGGDYHLQRGSPAANAGTRYGAPALDFEGDPRDNYPDLGADELTPLAVDVALTQIVLPADPLFAGPDPVQFGVTLFNGGLTTVMGPVVNCQIVRQSDGAVVWDRGITTNQILPGQMRYLTNKSTWHYTFDTADTFLFDCAQTTAGDLAPENDVLSRTLTVLSDAPDGWVKDNPGDTGDVPSGLNNWYTSPDIWVRHLDDGGLIHQDPIEGQTNYVYVRVRNRGSQPLDGTVDLTWIEPSLGTRCGDWAPIDTLAYTNLLPGEARVLVAPWEPTRSGHTCLQSILDSPQDPYDRALECTPQWVPWDNNLGWRNVNIYEAGGNPRAAALESEVQLANVYNTSAEVDLVVERLTFPTGYAITMTLGQELFDAWLASPNGWGEGIEVLTGSRQILVTGAVSSTVGAIPMGPGEQAAVGLAFDGPAGLEFDIAFRERIDGLTVGGVAYQWLLDDPIPPQVIDHSPAGGAAEVAVEAPLVITFDKAVGPLSLDLAVTPDPGGWTFYWNDDDTVVTATHAALALGTAYNVSVSASNAWAYPMVVPETWSFSTEAGIHQFYLPLIVRGYSTP